MDRLRTVPRWAIWRADLDYRIRNQKQRIITSLQRRARRSLMGFAVSLLFVRGWMKLHPLGLSGGSDVKIAYATEVAVTITLASLATSATWTAGQESTLIDNTSNKYLDYLLSGKITPTGTAGEIRVYVIAMIDESEWPDVFDGTDSAETVTNSNILNNLKLAWVQPVAAAATYPIQPISIASLFGGICPPKFSIFVTHSTGANLNSTASTHEITVKGVYETVG